MINPMMRSSPTRLMGLSSGMDTQSIVDATLRMHQFRIDNQLRNRRLIEWRQQTHNGIRDQITSLRQTFLSNLGSKSMMSRSAFNANVATATGRNADAVTLKAVAGNQTSNFRIGEIKQLARGARAMSANQDFKGISGSARIDSFAAGHSLSAASLGFNGIMQAELRVGNQNIIVNKTDVDLVDWSSDISRFTFDGSTATITRVNDNQLDFTIGTGDNQITGKLTFNNVTGEATATIDTTGLTTEQEQEYQQRADDLALQITREDDGSNVTFKRNGTAVEFWQEGKLTVAGSTDIALVKRANGNVQYNGANLDYFSEKKLDINGTEITLRSNMTINQMVTAVNNSNAGVKMGFETLTGRFTLETTATGAAVSLDLSAPANGAFFEKLGFEPPTVSGPMIFTGQNAEVYINGDLVSTNSNTFTFGGVSITLNRITDGGNGSDIDTNSGTIAVNVTRDTTDAVNKIKEFIDSYNTIIKKLEGLLSERKTGNEVSYRPLTDEEKRTMTDKQIEEWEAIARKGIVRSDQGIQNLVSNLRKSFFEEIEGMGISASQIGLSTGSYFDGTGGQIMINEERLRAALEEDPDRVADIFIKIDNSGGGPRGVGLLHKIDGIMRDFVNTNQTTTLKGLEDSLKRANDQIARMEQRMFAEEDRLYRQFAAMEKAMSNLNQQGDWFSAMLGTGK